jgi:diacylglycerol kinase (ATP)
MPIFNELRRLGKAFGYSRAGFVAAFQTQAAFRLDVLVCVILFPLSFWLGQSAAEKALLIGSLVLLLMAEILNTAIESVVDRVGLEYHQLAGRAKDLGSAGVLLALINGIFVWGLVLLDRLSGWQ